MSENSITYHSYIDLIRNKSLTEDDENFVLGHLFSYAEEETLFFSMKDILKDVHLGKKFLFLVREEGKNRILLIMNVCDTPTNKKILYLELLTGNMGNDRMSLVSSIGSLLNDIAKYFGASHICVDARKGWTKYLAELGGKEVSSCYVKEVSNG